MMRIARLMLLPVLLAPAATQAQASGERLTSAASADDPALDAAIAQLTAVLAKYPNSTLRPNALAELGELLARKAEASFAAAQRAAGTGATARGDLPERPDYAPAIARYEEVVRRYPAYAQIDAAAYTLGALYSATRRYEDAVRTFELVTARGGSRYRPEAYFRQGDAYFELAAGEKGDARRTMLTKATSAYRAATTIAPEDGDIYYLSLYKLGWAHYNQATRANPDEYSQAVDIFGRLVSEYDRLPPARQSRLGLRREALEYMAIALTQMGGAEAARQYFARHGAGPQFQLALLQRIAASLRDQGEFPKAVQALRAVIAQAPTDSGALSAQREIVDILQSRLLEADSAQRARLELLDRFAPASTWVAANPRLASDARQLREAMLRQSAQYSLARAEASKANTVRFAEAAELYGRYLEDFGTSDSAQVASVRYAQALLGTGDFMRAAVAYSRAAYDYKADARDLMTAGSNAIAAFDSALVRNRTDRGAQDSLFASVDRFARAFPRSDVAKKALVQKGRRASEAGRWDVMASTFQTYAQRYPADAYAPRAQRLVGDALYRQGLYTEAQAQWEVALAAAQHGTTSDARALADTITRLRVAAGESFADSLIKQHDYRRAAEEVYVAFADRNPGSPTSGDALRNAIETYALADSAARARQDTGASRQARLREIELSSRLVTQFPTYRYRAQYQNLRAQLLADVGRRDEAAEALRLLVQDPANAKWAGRADAMVRLGIVLDSLGRAHDAAAAYEQFASAYPAEERAADAQFKAAVTYAEAGDAAASARVYAMFATRYPRDTRAPQAQQARIAMLRASGDTAAAMRELTRACSRPSDALKAECAARAAEREFRAGQSLFAQYASLTLVIATPDQLNRAGVDRASAKKRAALQTMTTHFKRAIDSGSPEWLAAASYYAGLAQWEYGDFLGNVQLPASLTAEQRTQALAGSAQQAQQYYDAARTVWRVLVDKAAAEKISSPWVSRARDALAGSVPATPPSDRTPEPDDRAGGMP